MYMYTPQSPQGNSGHQNLHTLSIEYRFNQKHLKSGAKSSTITNISYRTQILRTRPLILGDRKNFLPLTEPNPTENLGQEKIFRKVDGEMCD